MMSNNRFLSSQLSSGSSVESLVEGYLDNSATSKCYPQAKRLLNGAAKACPGLLVMRLNKSWPCQTQLLFRKLIAVVCKRSNLS